MTIASTKTVTDEAEPMPGKPSAVQHRDPVLAALYPEYDAGGYTRDDQRAIFFSRVNALLRPDMDVLDFGAGRGRWLDEPDSYPACLAKLRGKCRRVVGVDVEAAVVDNPLLDEGVRIEPNQRLPFPDASFDMVTSFAVFEHLDEPATAAREIDRVLKPGGWLCAWTPNKWGYVALGARLLPDRLEGKVLRFVQDPRGDEDIFPKVYRMNTLRDIRSCFPPGRYADHSYIYNGQPNYFGRHAALARLWLLYGALTPSALSKIIHVFMRKR